MKLLQKECNDGWVWHVLLGALEETEGHDAMMAPQEDMQIKRQTIWYNTVENGELLYEYCKKIWLIIQKINNCILTLLH